MLCVYKYTTICTTERDCIERLLPSSCRCRCDCCHRSNDAAATAPETRRQHSVYTLLYMCCARDGSPTVSCVYSWLHRSPVEILKSLELYYICVILRSVCVYAHGLGRRRRSFLHSFVVCNSNLPSIHPCGRIMLKQQAHGGACIFFVRARVVGVFVFVLAQW